MAADDIDKALLTAAKVEGALLKKFGFEFSGAGTDERFTRIMNDAVCTRRLERAREDYLASETETEDA